MGKKEFPVEETGFFFRKSRGYSLSLHCLLSVLDLNKLKNQGFYCAKSEDK